MTHRFKICDSCGTATVASRAICPTCGSYHFTPIPLAAPDPDKIDEWDFEWLLKLAQFMLTK